MYLSLGRYRPDELEARRRRLLGWSLCLHIRDCRRPPEITSLVLDMVDGLVDNRDRRSKRRARRERQQVFVRHVPKGVIEPLPPRDVVRRCNSRTAGHDNRTRQRQSQNPDRLTSPHVATPSISPENTPDIDFIRTLRSALQSGCNEWPPRVESDRWLAKQ